MTAQAREPFCRERCDSAHANDGVIVGWVQPTGITHLAVGFAHPTNVRGERRCNYCSLHGRTGYGLLQGPTRSGLAPGWFWGDSEFLIAKSRG